MDDLNFSRSGSRVAYLVASLLTFVASPGWSGGHAGPMDPALANENGYEGRIRLTRFLDEPDGYCLDVPGPAGARVELPMVAHTCHPDPLADQVFFFNQDGDARIRWTYEDTDLCVAAMSMEVGAKLDLLPCADAPGQAFSYTDRGEFRLMDTSLCLHVEKTGPARGEGSAKGLDAYGRGRPANPQYSHLARILEMRTCGSEDPAMSRWMSTY